MEHSKPGQIGFSASIPDATPSDLSDACSSILRLLHLSPMPETTLPAPPWRKHGILYYQLSEWFAWAVHCHKLAIFLLVVHACREHYEIEVIFIDVKAKHVGRPRCTKRTNACTGWNYAIWAHGSIRLVQEDSLIGREYRYIDMKQSAPVLERPTASLQGVHWGEKWLRMLIGLHMTMVLCRSYVRASCLR